MKVLVLRTGGGVGGAEIYNLNLIRGFRKYYPEVELFFITANFDFARLLKKADAEAVFLPVFSEETGSKRGLLRFILASPKYFVFYLKEIIKFRYKKRIKLVFIQSLTEKIFLTPLLKILKFKVIWLEHGPVFAFKTSKIILNLYRLTSCLTDKIITVSEDAKTDLLKNAVEREKVVCIHTGVDTAYYQPQKNNSSKHVIGFVGAICYEKGVDIFIEVAKKITQLKAEVMLMLAGEGKKKTRKNFIYTGFQEDIRPYLGKFSIFFFPTKHLEGLSLAILEAMAMGIPVVARDIGGNREIVINGKTGILFTNETHEELAEILIRLLHDKERRKKMGLNARKLMVEKFNQKIWIDKIYRSFQ